MERIEQAYRAVRRENIAPYLTGLLNREGRGTRVEIPPLTRSQVDRPRQRGGRVSGSQLYRAVRHAPGNGWNMPWACGAMG